jgi:hypothetical protein
MSTLAKTTRRFAAREQRVYNSAHSMSSYMPVAKLNSEFRHAHEQQTSELHTSAESGPFAFTTGPYSGAGVTMKSGKLRKKNSKKHIASAKAASAKAKQTHNSATAVKKKDSLAALQEALEEHIQDLKRELIKPAAANNRVHNATKSKKCADAPKTGVAGAAMQQSTHAAVHDKSNQKSPKFTLVFSAAERAALKKIKEQAALERANCIKAATHQEYCELKKTQIRQTAKQTLEFYQGLKDESPSARPGLDECIGRAQKVLHRSEASKTHDTFWSDDVFAKFKTIKQNYADTIGMIYSANPGMDEECLQKLRVAAIKSRNEQIARLLKLKDEEAQKDRYQDPDEIQRDYDTQYSTDSRNELALFRAR